MDFISSDRILSPGWSNPFMASLRHCICRAVTPLCWGCRESACWEGAAALTQGGKTLKTSPIELPDSQIVRWSARLGVVAERGDALCSGEASTQTQLSGCSCRGCVLHAHVKMEAVRNASVTLSCNYLFSLCLSSMSARTILNLWPYCCAWCPTPECIPGSCRASFVSLEAVVVLDSCSLGQFGCCLPLPSYSHHHIL